MANSPLYYGDSKSSPIYYGASRPAYGGASRAPVYYGAGKAYGQYGGMYGGSSGAPGQEDANLVGTISIRRILRVISQRWLSIFVFLLVGIIVSFAIHSVSPRIYEAISEFTIDIRRNTGRSASAIDMAMPDLGNNYAEIFNTRQSQWRSESVVKKIIDNYQQKYEKSSVTDQELISTLASSQLELVRNSRIIKIAVLKSNLLFMTLGEAQGHL